MDSKDEVMKALTIGILVASFLLNSSRVPKAIDLCKECAILLNNKALEKEKNLVKSLYIWVYSMMFYGYRFINDYTSAMEYGRKLLTLLRRCGQRDIEAKVTVELGILHQYQGKYKKA